MAEESPIAGYRLAERLGQGGMGVVHRATDASGNEVAVKLLHSHVAVDPEARRRLAREVHTLQRVRHPRVAEVIDAELDAEVPFLVTQYVPGPSLSTDVGENGAFSPAELVHLGHGLLDALSAVHAVGVVHRDLKPANVMLLDGEPVVIDFGIAQAADDVQITATGLVMGTPGYLSPEVAVGNASTDATDWWGWGAVMAFAATGRAPFGAGPIEAVTARVRRGEADLADVPEIFTGLLRACLDPDPAVRPDGGNILDALVDIESGTTPSLPGSHRTEDAPTVVAGPAIDAPTEAAPAACRSPDAPTEAAPAAGRSPDAGTTRTMPAAGSVADHAAGDAAVPENVRGLGYDQPDAGRADAPYWGTEATGAYPYARQFPVPQELAGPPPAPPARSGTVAALFAASIAAFTLGPGVVLALVLVWSLLARTVGRVWQLRRQRMYTHGRPGTLATVGSVPGSFLLAIITTVFSSILPVLAAVAMAAIIWFLAAESVPGGWLVPAMLACSAFIGWIVAWWGPGGSRLRDGGRAILRACTPGTAGRFIVGGALLAIAAIAVGLALGGSNQTWWPVNFNPLTELAQLGYIP